MNLSGISGNSNMLLDIFTELKMVGWMHSKSKNKKGKNTENPGVVRKK